MQQTAHSTQRKCHAQLTCSAVWERGTLSTHSLLAVRCACPPCKACHGTCATHSRNTAVKLLGKQLLNPCRYCLQCSSRNLTCREEHTAHSTQHTHAKRKCQERPPRMSPTHLNSYSRVTASAESCPNSCSTPSSRPAKRRRATSTSTPYQQLTQRPSSGQRAL
jgi:hypothetical protein